MPQYKKKWNWELHYVLEGNISGHFSQKFDVFQSDFEASP